MTPATDATSMHDRIVALLRAARLPLDEEKRLQADIAQLLARERIVYIRERPLGMGGQPLGIIDFVVDAPGVSSAPEGAMVRAIGIEVKIAGSRPAEIVRQIERYARSPTVGSLILATSRTPAGWGAEARAQNGKRVTVVDLARAWL